MRKKLEVTHWGIYTEKIIIQKHMHTSVATAALLIIVRAWRQPKCPSNSGADKESDTYIQ